MNILITGGASGLGKEITIRLASDPNNKVYFTYKGSEKSAEALKANYSNLQPIKCDFNNEHDLSALIETIKSIDIDVLVNNAFSGSIEKQYFHKSNAKLFEKGFSDNIIPVIKITQPAILVFRKKRFGKIITVLSSAIVNKPLIGWSEYIAAKSYLHALSKSWAIENAAFNITSNTISPAFMQTAINEGTDERIIEEMVLKHPLKKLLLPAEVAESVQYFVNCSQQVNGVNLIINAASDVI